MTPRLRRLPVVSNGLDSMINMIDEPHRSVCRRVMREHGDLFRESQGSRSKHQAWPGGYQDHLTEGMNFIRLNHELDELMGRLPLLPEAQQYTLSDALLAYFLHDCEKPFRDQPHLWPLDAPMGPCETKAQRNGIRRALIMHWGFMLDERVLKAMELAEGVRDSEYSSHVQGMTPLGLAVHIADYKSAVYGNFPLAQDDPFKGAHRCNRDEPTNKHRPA